VLGSEYLSFNVDRPMAALPLVVYKYATGPYPEWHDLAWTSALILILVVLVLSIAARIVTRQRFGRRD
jgi:phosphate transport system permease protein